LLFFAKVSVAVLDEGWPFIWSLFIDSYYLLLISCKYGLFRVLTLGKINWIYNIYWD